MVILQVDQCSLNVNGGKWTRVECYIRAAKRWIAYERIKESGSARENVESETYGSDERGNSGEPKQTTAKIKGGRDRRRRNETSRRDTGRRITLRRYGYAGLVDEKHARYATE